MQPNQTVVDPDLFLTAVAAPRFTASSDPHMCLDTNVLPRLGIGADFTGQGLHGTLVMNSVFT